MLSLNDLKQVFRSFLPTGLAFRYAEGSNVDKLVTATCTDALQTFNDIKTIEGKIIPDDYDDLFDTHDAQRWEKVLGLYGNSEDTLENRKAAILRKMRNPSNVLGRQHISYIQQSLRDAGFAVTLYEYDDFKNYVNTIIQHKSNIYHGYDVAHGQLDTPAYTSVIANFLDPALETTVPSSLDNLRNAFFIAGDTFDTYIDIPRQRIEEFRNAVIALKPAQSVAFLRNVPFVEMYDFDFVKISYEIPVNRDIDTRTYFIDTGVVGVDNTKVGYGYGTFVRNSLDNYLRWGGDNQSGSEHVLIDFKLFHLHNPNLRSSKVRLSAHWFTGSTSQSTTVKLTTYKGGSMTKNGYDFVNPTATKVEVREFEAIVYPEYADLGYIAYDVTENSVKLTKVQ